MTQHGLRARLVTGLRGQLIVILALLFASFTAQVGIARRFTLSGLGEYVATTLVIFLAGVIATSALPIAAGERIARSLESADHEGASRAAGTGFVLAMLPSFAAAALVGLIWDLAASVLQLRSAPAGPVVAIAVVAAGALGYVPLLFQARLEMAVVGLIAIAQPFAVLLALTWDIFVPSLRPSTMAVIGYVSGGVASVAAFLLAGYVPRLAVSEIRPLVTQTARALPLLYANVFSTWVDRLLISVLLGPTSLGTYHAAAAFIEGPLRIPRGSTSFLVAAYARISVGHGTEIGRVMSMQMRLWVAYACPIAATLMAAGDGVVASLFGPQSTAVAEPLRILTIGLVPGLLSLLVTTAATGVRVADVVVAVSRITIPLEVVLMVVLALAFGVVGAAVAEVAAVVAGFVALLWWTSRRAPRLALEDLTRMLVASLAVVTLGALLAAVPAPWPARLAAGLAVASAIVFTVVLRKDELAVIRMLATRAT